MLSLEADQTFNTTEEARISEEKAPEEEKQQIYEDSNKKTSASGAGSLLPTHVSKKEKPGVFYLRWRPEDLESLKKVCRERDVGKAEYLENLFLLAVRREQEEQRKNVAASSKDESREQKIERLTSECASLKTQDLSGGRYQALEWLWSHVLQGDEESDSFLENLDPVIKKARESLRSKGVVTMTEMLYKRLEESLWDYTSFHGGTIVLGKKLLVVRKDDIQKFIELKRWEMELRSLSLQSINQRLEARGKKREKKRGTSPRDSQNSPQTLDQTNRGSDG